jgi:hypothetical protein
MKPQRYQWVRHTLLAFVFLSLAAVAWAQLPPPVVVGDDMLCPQGTGTVQTTQAYSTYQWRIRYFGSTTTADIPGATSQTLLMDYFSFAASYVSCHVSLGPDTATSAEFFVDGWAFLPIHVMSSGTFSTGPNGEFLICPGDTVFHTVGMPFNTNLQWYEGGNPIPGATAQTLAVTTPGVYWASGAPQECPSYVETLGTPLEVAFGPGCPVGPAPALGGDTTLCPQATGLLHTAPGYDAYQWFSRAAGAPSPTAIAGATGHTLAIDHAQHAGLFFSVQVSLNGQTATTPEVQVVGLSFPPIAVAVSGNAWQDLVGQWQMCPGHPFTLTVQPPYSVGLQWLQGGTPILGATQPSLQVGQAGSYAVVGAPAACPFAYDTLDLALVVVENPAVCDSVTAQPEPPAGPLALRPWPNPLPQGQALQLPAPASGCVFDAQGRELARFRNAHLLPTHHLPPGLYTLRLAGGQHARFVVAE